MQDQSLPILDILSNLITWITVNRSWIFSGIGIPILFFLVKFTLKVGNNSKIKDSSNVDCISIDDDFICEPRTLRIRYAQESDLEAISGIASKYLGEDHAISTEVLTEWLAQNREICKIIECFPSPVKGSKKWHVYGYYLILPLVDTTMELLKSGHLEDTEIMSGSVATTFNDPRVTSLYVMDLMVSDGINATIDGMRMVGGYLLRDLVWKIEEVLETCTNIHELVTITASTNGKALANKFGFEKYFEYSSDTGWEFWTLNIDDFDVVKLAEKIPSLKKSNRKKDEYTL